MKTINQANGIIEKLIIIVISYIYKWIKKNDNNDNKNNLYADGKIIKMRWHLIIILIKKICSSHDKSYIK